MVAGSRSSSLLETHRGSACTHRSMQHRALLNWFGTSLVGHVVFYQLIFTVPIAATFLYLSYSDGILTAAWAGYTVIVSAVFGLMVAAGIWYTITSPLLKRRRTNLER